MNNTPEKLSLLDKAIVQLANQPGFQQAQEAINAVINLLNIDADDKWKVFSDSNGKIRSNAGWFMLAEGFADKRAAYRIDEESGKNIDLKAYWMKNVSKTITSWLVALTPNFEDEPFFKSKNIGIDFIIPEKADRVIVVLSKNYVIRTLELSQNLSLTQKEIFHKWIQDFDFENKAQVHENLWNSFDLESVNKTFYKGISSFFVELKQHLADKKLFDERHAALFANRLMGRVIFCWFLDKKGFISSKQKYFDLEGKDATEYYQIKLEKLFFRTLNKKITDRGEDVYNLIGGIDEETPFLNGGLFTPKEDDYFGVKHITFPADYFDRIYTFLKHYNFTTDESTSSFQQVAIDPEMLGRIFENLLAEQVEETGEQARKAKGAFYTPREIVEYMCKESLREYLKSKFEKTDDSEQRISQLLDSKPHEWRDQQRNYREKLKKYKYEILQALDEIKVVDPACGSGAFPMGMLQLLLQTYERLDPTFDSYKKKLEIIKNNLFGIDIEPMAVEIARLRSWLSIIVDEELNPNAENMGIHPLPNLEFKFVCANSLIPAPIEEENSLFEDSFFTELEQKAKEFFEINDVEKKEAKKHELHELVDRKVKEKLGNAGQLSMGLNMGKFEGELKNKNKKAIDENIRLMQLWGSYTNIFTADEPVGFFETKYFFPTVREGFDIVIGNPPYIRIHKQDKDIDYKNLIKQLYYSAHGDFDIYVLFFEKSLKILKDNGILAFITPDKYLVREYGKKIRELILSYSIIELFDLSRATDIFNAATYPMISIIQKNDKKKYIKIKTAKTIKNLNKNYKEINLSKEKCKNENIIEVIDPEYSEILKKIFSRSKPLANVLEKGQMFCGTPRAKDYHEWEHYISKGQQGKNCLRVLVCSNLTPYVITKKKVRTVGLSIEDPYFNNEKKIISESRWQDFQHTPKILIRGNDTRITAVLDTEGAVFIGIYGIKIYGALMQNYKYLLSLLNSKLYQWIFGLQNPSIKIGGGFFSINAPQLIRLPFIEIPSTKKKQLDLLVDKILASRQNISMQNISALEKEIDQLVYNIYELTPEEIQIIEKSSL